jgi:hypothetical protein
MSHHDQARLSQKPKLLETKNVSFFKLHQTQEANDKKTFEKGITALT